MARVRSRVLKGGHNVPVEDQLRRYPRSYSNLASALQYADECILYDNSSVAGHRTIGYKRLGEALVLMEPLPGWAEFLHA